VRLAVFDLRGCAPPKSSLVTPLGSEDFASLRAPLAAYADPLSWRFDAGLWRS